MKNTKKLISVVLAVIMLLSTMVLGVLAADYTEGAPDANKVNVKFDVYQVPSVTMDATNNNDGTDGTYTAVGNNLYAVTVSIKAAFGVDVISIPCVYNSNHFDVLSYVDGTSNDDAFFGPDGTDDKVYVWKLGPSWSDDGSYTADGTPGASGKQQKCVGLAHSSATKVWPKLTMCIPTTSGYAEWTTGVDTANNGVVKIWIDDGNKGKNAYLNVYQGKIQNDYYEIITLYFVRKAAVSEEDCYGDVFGLVGLDKKVPDGSGDTSGNISLTAAGSARVDLAYGNFNIVNAAIESRVKSLNNATAADAAKAQQILFNSADSVDYRFMAQFSTTAFDLQYDSSFKVTSTNIDEIGFVMARRDANKTYAEFTAFDQAGLAGLDSGSGDIRKVTTTKVSVTTAGTGNFAFSCRIKNIPVAAGIVSSEYDIVPYVIRNDGTVFYGGQVLYSDIQGRYNTYHTVAGF